MNWNNIFLVLGAILLITMIFATVFISIEVDEERKSSCKNICEDRNMEYYEYDIVIKNFEPKEFCDCLSNGIINKFVLTRKDE